MSKEIILTKIPSKLIRLAIEDMKKTIAQGYSIDMDNWGTGELDNKKECSVCFGGCIMMQTTHINVDPIDFVNYGKNRKAFEALDSIRKGHLEDMLYCLDIDTFSIELSDADEKLTDFIEYEDCKNDQQFYDQMEQIAAYLELRGH